MSDSFNLPNPNPAAQNPTSGSMNYALTDVVYQQQDAIIIDGSKIPSIASANEAFIIFYLTQTDEQNGFGTVIQLDPQTKHAAIFADLNPEYTYLFFTEQGQLQTLLWCIEFATRTDDGLYVTHAKVHGKGLSPEDIDRLSNTKLSQQPEQHQLAEASSMLPPSEISQPSQSVPAPTLQQPLDPSIPPPGLSELDLPPLPNAGSQAPQQLDKNQLTQSPQTEPNPANPQPGSAAKSAGLPSEAATLQQDELALPPLPPQPDWNPNPPAQSPTAAAASTGQTGLVPPAPPLSQPEPSTPNLASPIDTIEAPSQPSELALPPMANQSTPPAQTSAQPVSQDILPPPPTNPAPANNVKPLLPQYPDNTQQQPPSASPAKLPVGRPPKPLTQDQPWMIEPQDFTWLKQISRDPMTANQEELRQKIIKQIRKNRQALIDDWQFHGAFEEAFQAISLTYDLLPSIRHDILKALLNGKVVDQVNQRKHQ